jgi:hypothetical protein
MTESKLLNIEKQMESIKRQLLEIGEMRPGSLTKQYRNPKEKKWAFFQLSYTYKMKSKTEYVRPQHVTDLKAQVKAYKKFKALTEKWVDLAIEHSKLKMALANRNQLK